MPHLLRRLELQGFKSFADKTVFSFPEGITAIVGPNGSGKSNVIDAIRWLLGERDAKSLRGGKSEDLIFAGTPKRPRVGQAHATLVFGNESHFFPVDHTEVSVARTVTRDGVSTYALNRSDVRLKDLVDFFAKARLGARGFVVITQGNSDLFIRVTPRERRAMIEEMLGLREYELRRSDAERRLAATDANSEKAKALIDEVLPHLRSLKRQTARWEKRGSLEAELQDLEERYFGTLFDLLKREKDESEEKLRIHEAQFKGLDLARAEAEAAMKRVEAGEPESRKTLAGVKERTKQLLAERSVLEKRITKLETTLEIASQKPTGTPSHEAALDAIRFAEHTLGSITWGAIDEVRKAVAAVMARFKSLEPVTGVSEADPHITRELADVQATLVKIEEEIASLIAEEDRLGKSQASFYAAFTEAVNGADRARRACEAWEAEKKNLSFNRERVILREEEWHRQVAQTGKASDLFMRGGKPLEMSERDAEQRMFKLRGDLASMGEVDEAILKEAAETEARYSHLETELKDLEAAKKDLETLIRDLNDRIRTEFREALVQINSEFSRLFGLMFEGGSAQMVLTKPPKQLKEKEEEENEKKMETIEDIEEGVEVELKLPKKRVTSLEVLSGGERSLVGIAALFALISVSPPPFLVLDEVDAPLDERNARRFADLLKTFSKESQFVVVTHNRATMEAAHVLYGVTTDSDGVSKVLSITLGEYEDEKARPA